MRLQATERERVQGGEEGKGQEEAKNKRTSHTRKIGTKQKFERVENGVDILMVASHPPYLPSLRLVPVAVAVAVPLPHLVAPCCRPAAPLVVKICCAPRRFPRGILKPSSALHLPLSLRVRLCVCECMCVYFSHSLPPSFSLSLSPSLCVFCFALPGGIFVFILFYTI